MNENLPPLGKVMNWLEASGFTVSYVYQDLVFVESNAFLIRFDHQEHELIKIHINTDCESSKALMLERKLMTEANKHGISPVAGERFSLAQKNDEEIDICFEN